MSRHEECVAAFDRLVVEGNTDFNVCGFANHGFQSAKLNLAAGNQYRSSGNGYITKDSIAISATNEIDADGLYASKQIDIKSDNVKLRGYFFANDGVILAKNVDYSEALFWGNWRVNNLVCQTDSQHKLHCEPPSLAAKVCRLNIEKLIGELLSADKVAKSGLTNCGLLKWTTLETATGESGLAFPSSLAVSFTNKVDVIAPDIITVEGLLVFTKSDTLIKSKKVTLSGAIYSAGMAYIECEECSYAEGRFYGSDKWTVNGSVCTVDDQHRLICPNNLP